MTDLPHTRRQLFERFGSKSNQLSDISITQTFVLSWRYLRRDGAKIWPRIMLPTLAGAGALFGSLFLYLVEFERYLQHPSDRHASLVLGIASAGLLLTLFMHSLTTVAIASLMLGRDDRGWKFFCCSHRAWRVFAAYLRFLVLCLAFLLGVLFAQNGLLQLGIGLRYGEVVSILMIAGLLFLAIRVGFLILPVAVANDQGRIIREAWRISFGHFWNLAVVVIAILLVTLGVEAVAEFAIRVLLHLNPIDSSAPLASVAETYRSYLPHVIVAVGVAYVALVLLASSTAVAIYNQMTGATKI